MRVPELQQLYQEVYGEPARSSHKQYLYRRIAWRVQAQSVGGLSERAMRRAVEIADDADIRTGMPQGFWSWPEQTQREKQPALRTSRDERLPEPGTVLKRLYRGRDIEVRVLDHGFEYRSQQYGSLSAIAKEVTGTSWNGLVFFRLAGKTNG